MTGLSVDEILALAPLLLFSLTIHEYAHAKVAMMFGDHTAKHMGRVSLNPIRHLDPIGTIAIFLVGFGWARPVPVNHANLQPRRLGDIAVSLAGPLSNFAMAILCGVIAHVIFVNMPESSDRLGSALAYAAFILSWTMAVNLALCIFNLMPLFPLDGHHVLRELLPPSHHLPYMHWQVKYGRLLLLGIIFVPRLMNKPGPLS
jgi:Zn-dependent protease